ncbi:MAG: PIG-L family deacetylase [Microthrixaceae bacterium]
MSRWTPYAAVAAAAHGLEPLLLESWRWAIAASARDDTVPSARRSCVVVAPHPDDETFGCGATIAAKRAHGTPVKVVIVADGRHAQSESELISAEELAGIRANEVVEACAALGVPPEDVIQLGHEDTTIEQVEDSVACELLGILEDSQPDEVLVVSRLDQHPDHRAVNRATHLAVAGLDHHPRVAEFPVWSWIDGPWVDQRKRPPVARAVNLFAAPVRTLLEGRTTSVRTAGYLDCKLAALAAHASQTTAYTDEPGWAVMDGHMFDPFVSDREVFLEHSITAEEAGPARWFRPRRPARAELAPDVLQQLERVPAISRRWNHLTSGDPATGVVEWVAQRWLGDKENLRVLMIGPAVQHTAEHWAGNGFVSELDVQAHPRSGDGCYDIVVWQVADPCTPDAERWAAAIREHLEPTGVLVVFGLTGTGRPDWSESTQAVADELLAAMPAGLRELRPGLSKERGSAPVRGRMEPGLLALLYEEFQVLEERQLGGALLCAVLDGVAANLGVDSESEEVLTRIFDMEDDLAAHGHLGSHVDVLVCRRRNATEDSPGDASPLVHGAELLMEDRFEYPVRAGAVIGSRATSGHTRLGVDREGTIAVDNQQLRIGWMQYPDYARSVVSYGPFDGDRPLVFATRILNGLTTSQSDWRAEGRRARLKRWAATLPAGPLRRPELRENLLIGWYREPVPRRGATPVAAVVHRAGGHQAGELWFRVGANSVKLCDRLQNIPATYALVLHDGLAELHAWSLTGAACFSAANETGLLASISTGPVLEGLYSVIHQPVLGEVFYRVDTRVDWVRVLAPRRDLKEVLDGLASEPFWDPSPGETVVVDGFSGDAGPLDTPGGDPTGPQWERVLGGGVFERTGAGSVRVVATREDPTPGRSIFAVPWDDPTGAVASVRVEPPGTGRGEAHRGRAGIAFWQDPGNHFIVNTYIDDAMVGVSLSAFLRTRGYETLFEWDAVWTNVAERISHGRPFELSVCCDGRRFLCRLDGEPVMYRVFSDYHAASPALRLERVGLAVNREWGDDTGSVFRDFEVRRLRP